MDIKRKDIIRKKILYKNKLDELSIGLLTIEDNKHIFIESYSNKLELEGYIDATIEKGELTLDTLYCYLSHRSKGVGSFFMDMLDYIGKDYDVSYIRGHYFPFEAIQDIKYKKLTRKELEDTASAFYRRNGFSIIELEDYEENGTDIEFLSIEDFNFFDISARRIIVKPLCVQDYRFEEINDIIVDKKIFENNKVMMR